MAISFEDFKKVEMRVGKILLVERISGSDKLLKLSVDFNEDIPRQVISGIGRYFTDLDVLIGKQYVFVTNLEPREIFGFESRAMIIAGSSETDIAFFSVPDSILVGTLIK